MREATLVNSLLAVSTVDLQYVLETVNLYYRINSHKKFVLFISLPI